MRAFTQTSLVETPTLWTLSACIDYARKNNLQVKSSTLDYENAQIELKTARAAQYPSLDFGSNQGFSNGNKLNDNGNFVTNPQYTGTYSLNTDIVIYNGRRLVQTVKQRKINIELQDQLVQKIQNDIEIAVTKSYLEVLYAKESLTTDSLILETSNMQTKEAEEKYRVGAINLSDLVQIKAQYGNDFYAFIVSKNLLRQSILSLKQLLELDIDHDINLYFPSIEELLVVTDIPSLHSVYYQALETMPEVKAAQLQIKSSTTGEKIAKAANLPSLTFNASVGTGHYTSADYSFLNQLGNNINENISIGIKIPIYQKREAKSAIEKAKISTQQSKLELQSVQKELLSTIESLYQNAISAKERYSAARLQLEASNKSYTLMIEQYKVGLKTLVELFTEKNNFISASEEILKAKYQAYLSIQLLNFYKNEPIEFF